MAKIFIRDGHQTPRSPLDLREEQLVKECREIVSQALKTEMANYKMDSFREGFAAMAFAAILTGVYAWAFFNMLGGFASAF
jgi:divalent metal cation (Fe/Co/Zn/Cd) transporter